MDDNTSFTIVMVALILYLTAICVAAIISDADWHLWFAWHPVRTFDHRLVWLRSVWCRRIQAHDHMWGMLDDWWQYAFAETHENRIADER